MRRRKFIELVISAWVTWPLAAKAQQPSKKARIGFLVTGSLDLPETRAGANAFYEGLREHGYIEGQNVVSNSERRTRGLSSFRLSLVSWSV